MAEKITQYIPGINVALITTNQKWLINVVWHWKNQLIWLLQIAGKLKWTQTNIVGLQFVDDINQWQVQWLWIQIITWKWNKQLQSIWFQWGEDIGEQWQLLWVQWGWNVYSQYQSIWIQWSGMSHEQLQTMGIQIVENVWSQVQNLWIQRAGNIDVQIQDIWFQWAKRVTLQLQKIWFQWADYAWKQRQRFGRTLLGKTLWGNKYEDNNY